MQNRRYSGTDSAYKTSSFNPDYVARLSEAMLNDEIAATLEHKQAVKSGRINDNMVRSVNPQETDLFRRISAITENPENNSAYRTQMKIEEELKRQNLQLKEDRAREAEYAKELKGFI